MLAAIGQIESGDGQNMGPSTAGALGPMQFLPSTWKVWGIDGFGETGPPDVMNPFDAVPSAARLLCADGAATGGQGLRQAIFDYNHANWYVDEVLTLAGRVRRGVLRGSRAGYRPGVARTPPAKRRPWAGPPGR